jgi:hypothetical protein
MGARGAAAGGARHHKRAAVLCLVLASALAAGKVDRKARENMAFGEAALSHIGAANLNAKAQQYKLKSGKHLEDFFKKDKDLAIDTVSSQLAYACSALVADNVSDASGRRLLHDHDHGHGHGHYHSRHWHEQLSSRLGAAGEARGGLERSRRRLNHFLHVDELDPLPFELNLTETGVPILHSRPAATRKIYLDFDGHTTRWARRGA